MNRPTDGARARSLGMYASLAACGIATTLFAHSDDPKADSLIAPYQGPGWSASVHGFGPLAQSHGFPADGVALNAWLPIDDFAGSHGNANDIWGYVSPSGREYAILGLQCGNGFVEVTNPDSPTIVDTIASPCSLWGDIKVHGAYAYVVSEDSTAGVQVIDMTDIDNGNVSVANTFGAGGGAGSSHNIVVDNDSGMIYRVGGAYNGYAAYDLNSSATNPALAGSWDDRYIHDAQVITFPEGKYAGRQIMFACSGDNGGWENGRLEILDVTDPDNPVTLGEAFYDNTVYSHQVWVSEDLQYAYLNDELDESVLGLATATRVFSVSDLTAPAEIATFGNGLETIDHNLYIVGDFLFEANYTSGLRVFDRSDPVAPVEIAYFDTRPEGDETDFLGLWSNYPFLPSRTVLASDEQRGLFVLTVEAFQVEDCPNDLSGNGVIDFADILAVLAAWGEVDVVEDLDGNGTVDFADILVLLADWGTACP